MENLDQKLDIFHRTQGNLYRLEDAVNKLKIKTQKTKVSQENATQTIKKLAKEYNQCAALSMMPSELEHYTESHIKPQINLAFEKYGDLFIFNALKDTLENPENHLFFKQTYTHLLPDSKKELILSQMEDETIRQQANMRHRDAAIDYDKVLTYKALIQDNALNSIKYANMATEIITSLQQKSGLSENEPIAKILEISEQRIFSFIPPDDIKIINARFNLRRTGAGLPPLLPDNQTIELYLDNEMTLS